jgi:hypothetical protein
VGGNEPWSIRILTSFLGLLLAPFLGVGVARLGVEMDAGVDEPVRGSGGGALVLSPMVQK